MDTYRQKLAATFCFLFGLALIGNTQSVGDGGWYWYALLVSQGKRLYADMHLALQPLYILETEFSLALFGKGWAVSKIVPVLHLLAFCIGFLLLAQRSEWKDHQKALLMACGFFVSIRFEGYRFDDYHVLADCCFLYSLLLLLLLLENRGGIRRNAYLAAGLGTLSGLTLITRLNDGAVLIMAVAAIILCVTPGRKPALIALFSLAAALTVLLSVHLTGDSLRDYAVNSIFRAAGAKGGAANVLTYPFLLPANAARTFIDPWTLRMVFVVLVVALSWAFLLRPFLLGKQRFAVARTALGTLAIGIVLVRFVYDVRLILMLLAVCVLVTYGLGLAVAIRFFRSRLMRRRADGWDTREFLLLVPLGMMVSVSMSSGGGFHEMYTPSAALILMLPISSPIRLHEGWRRSAFLAIAAMMMLSGLIYKSLCPLSWLSYRCPPVFVDRQVFDHAAYGPMIIDTQLLQFIVPICDRIRSGAPQPEFLSLPLPYANYFCGIPPWHGYVQTFFDTSTKRTITGLMEELQRAPPEWILYQRQMGYLSLHEEIFNRGQRLPHRDLDELIMRKIDQGAWLVAERSQYAESEWILVRTLQ